MTATDEALLARLNGECEPLGRSLSMVDTKDLRAFIADYRLKCELLRRASPPPSQDAVVEYTIKVDRAGNITNDTQCFNSSFADVYRAFHSIRAEVDRQIAERRICPYNPINPQPPEFSDTPAPSHDETIKALVEALDKFGEHENWCLEYVAKVYADDLKPEVDHWAVVEVSGPPNDRDWSEIGVGSTPHAAIAAAILALVRKGSPEMTFEKGETENG